MLGKIGAGRRGMSRANVVTRFVVSGARDAMDMLNNHAYAAEQLATQLGLPAPVGQAVVQTFERFDGKGAPLGRTGTDIALPARVVNLADVLAVFYGAGGSGPAIAIARQRSGSQFDPELVELVAADREQVFLQLDIAATWAAVIDGDPAPSCSPGGPSTRRCAGGDRRFRRPQIAVHPRSHPSRR